MTVTITRRTFIGATIAVSGLVAVGCKASTTSKADGAEANRERADGRIQPAGMTVYRDPSCGCCTAWAGIARQAGYEVSVIDHPDMPAIKQQYGVPDELRSCHTTIVDGYAVEGHVPMGDVQRLLAERPADLRGIAVAGMPLGSPGMEVPDGTVQPFEVMAFDAKGAVRPFRA